MPMPGDGLPRHWPRSPQPTLRPYFPPFDYRVCSHLSVAPQPYTLVCSYRILRCFRYGRKDSPTIMISVTNSSLGKSPAVILPVNSMLARMVLTPCDITCCVLWCFHGWAERYDTSSSNSSSSNWNFTPPPLYKGYCNVIFWHNRWIFMTKLIYHAYMIHIFTWKVHQQWVNNISRRAGRQTLGSEAVWDRTVGSLDPQSVEIGLQRPINPGVDCSGFWIWLDSGLEYQGWNGITYWVWQIWVYKEDWRWILPKSCIAAILQKLGQRIFGPEDSFP